MLILLAQPDNADHQAALLEACLTAQTYDKQLEDSREGYFFELIKATGNPGMYRDALLAALTDPGGSTPPCDRVQCFSILCLFAQQDPTFDRELLRTFATSGAVEDGGSAYLLALVRLEGIDGLSFVARHFHAVLSSAQDDWGWLFGALVDELGELSPADRDRLMLARRQNSFLDALFRQYEHPPQEPRPPDEPYVPFAELIARDEKFLRFTKHWIRQATVSDLEAAAHAMLAEQVPNRLWRYARLFKARPYPLALEPLVEKLLSSDNLKALPIADIVGQVRHPDVRRLALDALATPGRIEIALYLLQQNYEAGDAALILSSLKSCEADDQVIHGLGMRLRTLAEVHGDPSSDWEQLLTWAYRETPCSLCRTGIVGQMARLKVLSDPLVAECLHDADKDTVRLARDWLREREAETETENNANQ
ncbi:hypothetical protein [Oryzibacter oryziterrae]|uniref:hypothetical protein n=1 Tax=Oryzibacter oryziterrae TaxID=2766474 RepID=UPI001F42B363|nr:hypothetical protein [Oryzibacter oryziterrae]